jgi:hypothetical protein
MPAGAVLKKSWGHRFRDGPNPVTSVELVEALPAETAAREREPPTLARRFPVGPGDTPLPAGTSTART